MAPKECTLCHTPRQILVRCQIDESGVWNFLCPGKCWTSVSGGVEDARGFEGRYPRYRYGGMWKDRHADGPVSAKKPGRVKERQRVEARRRRDALGAEARNREGSGEVGEQDVDDETDGDREVEDVERKGAMTQVQDPGDAA
ncbi:uncharacterized protein EKO05_0003086 [Ascochyta rabiei]|uniref:Uncharacterized protein n=1 Tax=Didymella rabiei TaxID=5454 RepID=A0A162XBY3_DIDRA|nr:uncharacterized protein EKO05_0003086 [Ascochyta rabiei]KZM19457.1 hypothetical protein ST47_g9352 [Ascochyta rabiei]UPX12541.1 hypothetical protein EKO05_0003086 [Ascochyta rabiei]